MLKTVYTPKHCWSAHYDIVNKTQSSSSNPNIIIVPGTVPRRERGPLSSPKPERVSILGLKGLSFLPDAIFTTHATSVFFFVSARAGVPSLPPFVKWGWLGVKDGVSSGGCCEGATSRVLLLPVVFISISSRYFEKCSSFFFNLSKQKIISNLLGPLGPFR